MYRTGDPRFRRRLNELGQTLENANESAQTGIYHFGTAYIKPCFNSVIAATTTCVDASCPSLNLSQREQARRHRGRSLLSGRAELNFDFYDDWDEEENEGLLGWGNDEFDRLIVGDQGYGTLTNAQPARQRGMSYPKGRRRSATQTHDGSAETGGLMPGKGLLARLFGGKGTVYRPSAANLQEHPGAGKQAERGSGGDVTEGEALLGDEDGERRKHRRVRSSTVGSGHTTDSLSSRGDIFPSDGEDDAVPLDDEFAMVLERRTTQSGGFSGPDTEASSDKTKSRKRSKRPSAGSRMSTRRTLSSRSMRSASGKETTTSRRSSSARKSLEAATSPLDEDMRTMSMSELKQEEQAAERSEETSIERRRTEAQRLANERGLAESTVSINTINTANMQNSAELPSSKEATPTSQTPDEPSQLPTPIATDDEDEAAMQLQDHSGPQDAAS